MKYGKLAWFAREYSVLAVVYAFADLLPFAWARSLAALFILSTLLCYALFPLAVCRMRLALCYLVGVLIICYVHLKYDKIPLQVDWEQVSLRLLGMSFMIVALLWYLSFSHRQQKSIPSKQD